MKGSSLVVALVGLLAGLSGYFAYTRSGSVASAFAVTLAVGWLLYRFSSGDKAWDTFGLLLSPPTSALLFFLAGFTYFAIQGSPFGIALIIATAFAFIGAVLAMIFSNYW